MASREQGSVASMPLLPKQSGCAYTWTMKACLWFSVCTCVAAVLCGVVGGVTPRWTQTMESDLWHAAVSNLLVVSIAITELCIVLGASNAKITETLPIEGDDAPKVNMPRADYSWLTLLEYVAKLAVGAYTYAYSGGIVHTDTLAWNGARPVYMVRYAQWSFAVPVIVLITNSPFIESREELVRRSWPSCFAAFSYVWASWLSVVTPHQSVRWLMMTLALGGDVFVLMDQLKVAAASRSASCHSLKIGLLWYSKLVDLLYTTVFLMGRFGVISSGVEHMIYPYSDATAKVLHGALLAIIRSREGANEISRWCAAAVAAGNDLKYLLRQAKIPTLTIDLSGNIVQWNESIAQLTGLQEGTVHGKSLLSLSEDSYKDDLSKVLAEKRKAFEAGTSSTEFESGLLELSIITNTKQHVTVPPVRRLAMTLVPKRNAVGELTGITAIGQDLSEIADLKMVEERKNALLAMLGHEIRSPLHGMMGLTCSLLENTESKHMHRQLGMVKGCTARLLDLVTNIMDLAQSEKKKMSGVAEVKPTSEVNLPSIVEEAMVMIGNAVDKANRPLLKPGVRLVNDSIGTKVPLVRGDAYKCTQLLYNLMTNAAKFTDRGSISVSFRHMPEANQLAIDVTDTGKGISEAGVKRIFLPFEQENSGDHRSYQGIGLGLAVCKQIAEFHDGSLSVKSVVGKGSTFTFTLPCDGDMGTVEVQGERMETYYVPKVPETKVQTEQMMKPDTGVCSPLRSESAPASGSASKSRRATKPLILSVDDDDVNQEVVMNALSDSFEVVCTMSGHETLGYLDELVKSKQAFPEIILLDIQMPGMTGFEVCERVRSHYGADGASLPVMMLSAKAPVEKTAIQSFECGATDFIAKPFHTVILKKKVMAVLNLKRSEVRPGGAGESEASQQLKEYEMEATRAKEHAAELEVKLTETEERAAQATDKAKHLELELVSVKESAESQRAEVRKLSKKCDDMQVLMQRKELQPRTPSTKVQAHAKCKLHSSEQLEVAELGDRTSFPHKAGSVKDASFVIKLLVSRLEDCSKSAKSCKILLRGCLRPSVQGADRDTQALEPPGPENSCYECSKFRRCTHVAVSKLAMLEDAALNVGGIVNMIGDEGVSTESEARESETSQTRKVASI